MNKFLASNKSSYKLARTIVQGVLGVLVDNLAMIIAQTQFDASVQTLIVAGTMAVLSPVMAALGKEDEKVRDNA